VSQGDKQGDEANFLFFDFYLDAIENRTPNTQTEYIVLSSKSTFIAIQIAELLKCMLCRTVDVGSELDTLDDIETEKNCPYPQIINPYYLCNHC